MLRLGFQSNGEPGGSTLIGGLAVVGDHHQSLSAIGGDGQRDRQTFGVFLDAEVVRFTK